MSINALNSFYVGCRRRHTSVDVTVIKTGCSLTGALMRAFVAAFLHEGAVASQCPVGHTVFPQQVALTVGFGGEEGVAARTRERLLTWVEINDNQISTCSWSQALRHAAFNTIFVCVCHDHYQCVSACVSAASSPTGKLGDRRGRSASGQSWSKRSSFLWADSPPPALLPP